MRRLLFFKFSMDRQHSALKPSNQSTVYCGIYSGHIANKYAMWRLFWFRNRYIRHNDSNSTFIQWRIARIP